jgi:hypothetical protein
VVLTILEICPRCGVQECDFIDEIQHQKGEITKLACRNCDLVFERIRRTESVEDTMPKL